MKKEYQSPYTTYIQVETNIICVSTGGGSLEGMTPGESGVWE